MPTESDAKAVVDTARCYGCGACTTVCAPKAIAIIMYKAVVDPEKCTGCGRCVDKCAVGVMSMGSPG